MDNKFTYSGLGETSFEDGKTRVRGRVSVEVDERGRVEAVMDVSEVSSAANLQEGLAHLAHISLAIFITDKRDTFTLSVELNDGIFFTLPGFAQRGYHDTEVGSVQLSFSCMRSMFVNKDVGEVRYWRFPVCNLHAGLSPAFRSRSLVHPLRSSTDAPISFFEYASALGFVEAVSDHRALREAQRSGDRSPRVTAHVVGAMNGGTETWEELKSWFPFEILDLLSFANGFRVGLTYIEVMSDTGVVLKRFHLRAGSNALEVGDPFLDDVIHKGGLGRLITAAYTSNEIRKPYLRSCLRNLTIANRSSFPLEDAMAHISRALDALAEQFDLATQRLLEDEDEPTRVKVRAILASAASEIKALAGDEGANGANLQRISERVMSTPANVDRAFGLAVLALTERYNLKDAEVIDRYLEARGNGRRWPSLISYYRGICQHGRSFDFDNEHAPLEVHRTIQHLIDLCARMALKTLEYDGEYQHRNATWTDAKHVDWVHSATSPKELGYGMDAPK